MYRANKINGIFRDPQEEIDEYRANISNFANWQTLFRVRFSIQSPGTLEYRATLKTDNHARKHSKPTKGFMSELEANIRLGYAALGGAGNVQTRVPKASAFH